MAAPTSPTSPAAYLNGVGAMELRSLFRRHLVDPAVVSKFKKMPAATFVALSEDQMKAPPYEVESEFVRQKLLRMSKQLRKDPETFIHDSIPPHIREAGRQLDDFYQNNGMQDRVGKAQSIVDDFADAPQKLLDMCKKTYANKQHQLKFLQKYIDDSAAYKVRQKDVARQVDELNAKAGSPLAGRGEEIVASFSDTPKELYEHLTSQGHPADSIDFVVSWGGFPDPEGPRKEEAATQKRAEERVQRENERAERERLEREDAERKRQEQQAKVEKKKREEEERRRIAEKAKEEQRMKLLQAQEDKARQLQLAEEKKRKRDEEKRQREEEKRKRAAAKQLREEEEELRRAEAAAAKAAKKQAEQEAREAEAARRLKEQQRREQEEAATRQREEAEKRLLEQQKEEAEAKKAALLRKKQAREDKRKKKEDDARAEELAAQQRAEEERELALLEEDIARKKEAARLEALHIQQEREAREKEDAERAAAEAELLAEERERRREEERWEREEAQRKEEERLARIKEEEEEEELRQVEEDAAARRDDERDKTAADRKREYERERERLQHIADTGEREAIYERWVDERERARDIAQDTLSRREALRELQRQKRNEEQRDRAAWEQPLQEGRARMHEMERALKDHETRDQDQQHFIKELYFEQNLLRARLDKKRRTHADKATEYFRDESGSPIQGMKKVLQQQQQTLANLTSHIAEADNEINLLRDQLQLADYEQERTSARLRDVKRSLLHSSPAPSPMPTSSLLGTPEEAARYRQGTATTPHHAVPSPAAYATPPSALPQQPYVTPPHSACTCPPQGRKRKKAKPEVVYLAYAEPQRVVGGGGGGGGRPHPHTQQRNVHATRNAILIDVAQEAPPLIHTPLSL